jgi:Domain of unknown function (DUF4184)
MPFTLSHPALVLPLNLLPKKWVSITGLIIGSLAPDLQSYTTPSAAKTHTHTWWGIFWFCIPAAILLSFIYHLFVREMLITHLPRFLQIKFIRYKDLNWAGLFRRNWPVILLSIVIGAASHLFWDSFSHYDGYFIRTNPAFQGNMDVFGKSTEIPFVIQYVNSIIGLLVVVFAILQVPRCRNVRIRVVIMKFWVITGILTLVLSFLQIETLGRLKLDDVLTSMITALAISLLITSLLFRNGTVRDSWGTTPKKS